MQKLAAVLLLFLLMLPLAHAEDSSGTIILCDITWTVSEDGTVLTLTYTGGEDGISDMTDFYDFTEDDVPWFAWQDTITTVYIDGNITHIGDCAFGGYDIEEPFPNLTTVVFGGTYKQAIAAGYEAIQGYYIE